MNDDTMSKPFELVVSFDDNQSLCTKLSEEESYVDDSDNDCPPPPPSTTFCFSSSLKYHHSASPSTASNTNSPLPSPPPSSPSSTQSATNYESYDTQSSKECKEEIAIRFHQYVLSLKCICGWNECIVQRKQIIASKKQLLKRILFKWIGHVEDVRSRRNSITILSRLLHIVGRRALQYGMVMLCTHCTNSKIVERIFLSWRDFAIAANHDRMTKEFHAIHELSLSKTRLYLQNWRKTTSVNMMVDCKRNTLLSNVLKYWHHVAKESSLGWIKKMEHATALMDAGRLEMLGKIFKCLVSEYCLHPKLFVQFVHALIVAYLYLSSLLTMKRVYAFKKKNYRTTLYQFAFTRAERIMRISIQSWKQNHRLVKQRCNIIIKIMKRQTFTTWRAIVGILKRQEYISVQIIFNRWRCVAEERAFKREWILLALNHRVRYIYKQVLIFWKKVTTDAKGMLRTPSSMAIHKMRCTFSSDHYLNTAHYNRKLSSCSRQASTLARRHSAITFGGPFGCHHLHRPKFMQHNTIRSHDPISRRPKFVTHDSEFMSRSSTGTYSIEIPRRQHNICHHSNISCLGSSKLKPISFNLPNRISPQTNSLGNQRPLEHLMGVRLDSERKLSVPPWILNDLSNREAKKDRGNLGSTDKMLHSITTNKEIFNVPAEPKYNSEKVFSSVKPAVKKSWNDSFPLSKCLSYSNEGKEIPHK